MSVLIEHHASCEKNNRKVIDYSYKGIDKGRSLICPTRRLRKLRRYEPSIKNSVVLLYWAFHTWSILVACFLTECSVKYRHIHRKPHICRGPNMLMGLPVRLSPLVLAHLKSWSRYFVKVQLSIAIWGFYLTIFRLLLCPCLVRSQRIYTDKLQQLQSREIRFIIKFDYHPGWYRPLR